MNCYYVNYVVAKIEKNEEVNKPHLLDGFFFIFVEGDELIIRAYYAKSFLRFFLIELSFGLLK